MIAKDVQKLLESLSTRDAMNDLLRDMTQHHAQFKIAEHFHVARAISPSEEEEPTEEDAVVASILFVYSDGSCTYLDTVKGGGITCTDKHDFIHALTAVKGNESPEALLYGDMLFPHEETHHAN